MTELARHIKVIHHLNNEYVFEIDGQEFPWHISENGVTVGPINRNEMPRITIEIIAETVDVEHSVKSGQ